MEGDCAEPVSGPAPQIFLDLLVPQMRLQANDEVDFFQNEGIKAYMSGEWADLFVKK